MDDPIGAARALVEQQFPDAVAAFLCGSTAYGRGTRTSDLDIVVVRPGPSEVYRESLSWRGWPVELFAHTERSVRGFFELDRASGTATLAFMCERGAVLLDTDGTAARIRALAAEALAAGPGPAGEAVLEEKRYTVTDLRDDLIGASDRPASANGDEDELLAIAAQLLERAAELLLTARGHWRGGGKWLPRRLREAEPELAGRLLGGYRTLVRGGSGEPLAEAVSEVLELCGGPLWVGYRRTAPASVTQDAPGA